MKGGRDARHRTVQRAFGVAPSLEGPGGEVGPGRGPGGCVGGGGCRSGMGVFGVWEEGASLRSRAGAGVAAPQHMPLPDLPARSVAAGQMSGAWGAAGPGTLGGSWLAVHLAV